MGIFCQSDIQVGKGIGACIRTQFLITLTGKLIIEMVLPFYLYMPVPHQCSNSVSDYAARRIIVGLSRIYFKSGIKIFFFSSVLHTMPSCPLHQNKYIHNLVVSWRVFSPFPVVLNEQNKIFVENKMLYVYRRINRTQDTRLYTITWYNNSLYCIRNKVIA